MESRGMTGRILGRRADFILVDDPTKPEDAAAETTRKRQLDHLRQQVFTRVDPGGRIMVIGHLAAFAQGAGFSRPDAAIAVGVLSVGNGCGRIGSGWMSDHFGRTRTLAVVMGVTALLLFFEPEVETRVFLFASVFLIGYCYGSQLAVFPSATADYFGVRNLGNNYGVVVTAWGTAGIIGPMVGGKLFDATKSYSSAFHIAALLALLAAILVSTVRPPAPPKRTEAKRQDVKVAA